MHFSKALKSLGTNPRASCLPAPGEFTHSALSLREGTRPRGQDRRLHQKPVKFPSYSAQSPLAALSSWAQQG